VANAFTRRAGEIGVRMALGASRSSVVTMAFSDTARIVVAGLAIGAPMTVVARRMIASRRYDVAASDLATIGVAMLTLTAVTAIAGIRDLANDEPPIRARVSSRMHRPQHRPALRLTVAISCRPRRPCASRRHPPTSRRP
jgi:hypothetical protein